jgi:putative transposase
VDPIGELSIRLQCDLLHLHRSGLYYQLQGESELNLEIMNFIDREYTKTPFYGSRRVRELLSLKVHKVNRKRVQRLMRKMGIAPIYPKKRLSISNKDHRIYPYLLRDVKIVRSDQVWSTDITYIPMTRGFIYLVAIIDWYSRYVIAWKLSNTLDATFCVEALNEAFAKGKRRPEVFNSDQGSQFTCAEFIAVLERFDIKISMDGRGRAFDNIFVERLWRTVKYEEVYLHEYETIQEAQVHLTHYFQFYNSERLHQSLGYLTPREVYVLRESKTNNTHRRSVVREKEHQVYRSK